MSLFIPIFIPTVFAFILGIWALGRYIDPTVETPFDALDAIIERFFDP